jgi:hypothetical protein
MAKRNGAKAQTAVAETEQPVSQPKTNKPVHEVRLGRIRASVWLNRNSKGEEWFSVTLSRSYKDAQGAWKNASSLGLDDLLVAGEVLKQAALWIYQERQGEHRESGAQDGTAATTGTEPPIPF